MKKKLLILATLFFCFSMNACMSHIEDSNGDDTALVTIDLEQSIADKSYSSISSLTTSTYSGGRTYCFNYDDIDYDNMNLSYGKISGVSKIQCSDMYEGQSLSLTITSDLTEGNLEIAVVAPDGTIVELVAVNTTVTVTIPSTQDGEYFVVIGAESAKFTIQIVRNIS